jgi:hypothetical protein
MAGSREKQDKDKDKKRVDVYWTCFFLYNILLGLATLLKEKKHAQ